MSDQVETLGELEVYQRVRVTLDDETTIEGEANPIDYVPEESLRVELQQDDEPNVRYQFAAEHEAGGWSDVEASRLTPEDEDGDWDRIGTVAAVEPHDKDA